MPQLLPLMRLPLPPEPPPLQLMLPLRLPREPNRPVMPLRRPLLRLKAR